MATFQSSMDVNDERTQGKKPLKRQTGEQVKVEVEPNTKISKTTCSHKTALFSPVKQKSMYIPFLKPLWSDLQRRKLFAEGSRQWLGSDITQSYYGASVVCCLFCTLLHREVAAQRGTGPERLQERHALRFLLYRGRLASLRLWLKIKCNKGQQCAYQKLSNDGVMLKTFRAAIRSLIGAAKHVLQVRQTTRQPNECTEAVCQKP